MFSVYIIHSAKLDRFYIGTTDNVDRRVFEHNNSTHLQAFTAKGIPWTLFLSIDNLHSQQAYLIEQHIKRMKSANFIKNLKKHPDLVSSIVHRFQ